MNKLSISHDWPVLLAIVVLLLFTYLSNKPKEFKGVCFLLLAAAVVLMLFGCSPGKCYPSKKSKDFAVRSWWLKQQADGYWIHHREVGFLPPTNYRFECKISDQELERFYDSLSKKK